MIGKKYMLVMHRQQTNFKKKYYGVCPISNLGLWWLDKGMAKRFTSKAEAVYTKNEIDANEIRTLGEHIMIEEVPT